MVEVNGFVNLDMVKRSSTWKNCRVGEATVARRINIFFIKSSLIASITLFHHWVCIGCALDHCPIIF